MNWTEEERRIFSYQSHDGSKTLYADPMAVRGRLMARSMGKIDDLVEKQRIAAEASNAIAEGSKEEFHPGIFVEGADAEERITECVIYAFDLEPFNKEDGTGATQKYCLNLFNDFNEWREKKNPSTVVSQHSSPDMDGLPDHLRSHTMRMSDLAGMSTG